MRKRLILGFVFIALISLTSCAKESNSKQVIGTSVASNFKVYDSKDGWSINYPISWSKVEENFIQEESTGKTIEFYSDYCSRDELEKWIESEIKRKLDTTEADNVLTQRLQKKKTGNLLIYTYTIGSRMEESETLLKNTIFFDGNRRYEFRAAIPPVTELEYNELVESFKIKE